MGGHIVKVKDHLEETFHVRDNVSRLHQNALTIVNRSMLYAELGSLTKEELVVSVKELNAILKENANSTREKVYFGIMPGSATSLIWKGIVRIACFKIDSDAQTCDIIRVLSLPSYWSLRHGLYQQLSVKAVGEIERSATDVQLEQTHDLTSSNVLARIHSLECIEESECCICMEMRIEVSLSCAHGFCKTCIDEWTINHQSCPTCRGAVDSDDEFWEMPCIPCNAEIDKLIVATVSGLKMQ